VLTEWKAAKSHKEKMAVVMHDIFVDMVTFRSRIEWLCNHLGEVLPYYIYEELDGLLVEDWQ
jgi:hypothetical protein